MDYENGLRKLSKYVAKYFEETEDSQLRDKFDLYKFRLRCALDEINQHGSTKELNSEINKVISLLNTITRQLNIGMTFDDLCVQKSIPKPICDIWLKKLVFLLLKAFSLPNDEKLREFYEECVPPNMSAPQNYKRRDILICLAEMGKSSTDHVPMLDFLVQLMPYTKNPKAINALKAWMKVVGKHLTLTEAQIDELLDNDKPQRNTTVPLHLLIELEPEEDDLDNFIVHAWRVKSPENIQNIFDEGDKTFVLKKMPKLMGNLLDSIKPDLIAANDQLTIEFFLPFNLLCHPVDHWPISDPIQDDVPIGIRYPVVIRSRDRLRNDIFWPSWKAHWDNDKLHKVVSDTDVVWMNEDRFRAVYPKLNGTDAICLVMTFPHETIVNPKQAMLSHAIRLGAPIALWSRKIDESDDIQQELSALLSVAILEELPERVRKKREEKWAAGEEHKAGYNLSLLWDDPNRIPVANLESPTQQF
jgi:hypothetical protein